MKKYQLMAPGPTPVPSEVLLAMAKPIIHHRTPEYEALFIEVRAALKKLFQTAAEVIPLACSGTGAMEAAVVNTLSAGDRVIVVRAGKFGDRWLDLAKAYGLDVIDLSAPFGQTVDAGRLAEALKSHPEAKAVLVQHSETSTGVLHDVRAYATATRSHDAILIVDAVSSLGIADLPMDAWGIDLVISGSQKGLMPPGLGFCALSEKAWRTTATSTLPKFYFSLADEPKYVAKNEVRFTPAVSIMVGLREALRLIEAEGQPTSKRHDRLARDARGRRGARARLFAKATPSPAVTAVVPRRTSTARTIVAAYSQGQNITIAGGQGEMKGKLFRPGAMGYAAEVRRHQRAGGARAGARRHQPASRLVERPRAQKIFAEKSCSGFWSPTGYRPSASDALRKHGLDVEVVGSLAERELAERIGEYEGLIVRSATKVTRPVIEAGRRLEVIGRAGAGVDTIDVDAATQRGVVVMNTPGGNTTAVAEHTLGLLLALARRLPAADVTLKAGRWEKNRLQGVELLGKILGIVGLGRIGSEVARRALGFRMQVIAYDPYLTREAAERLGVDSVELDELLARADFITIHTPLTGDTRHLLGEAELQGLKPGVRIINCARRRSDRQQALVRAIQSGRVAGAALDVFEQEPPPADHPLLKLEQVIVTPHWVQRPRRRRRRSRSPSPTRWPMRSCAASSSTRSTCRRSTQRRIGSKRPTSAWSRR
jgi:aspartate aminotransferase-like enzyme/phosphoglycerate dehydrogenase-like enzyme